MKQFEKQPADERNKKEKELSRREFLSASGKMFAGLVGIGLFEMVTDGVKKVEAGSEDEPVEIDKEAYEKKLESIDDPHGLKEYLIPGEYVLPKDVLKTYFDLDKSPLEKGRVPAGMYQEVSEIFKNEKNEEKFQRYMKNIGYKPEDVKLYFSILKSKDSAFFVAEHFKRENYWKAFEHERMHRFMKETDERVYQKMKEVSTKFATFKHKDIFPTKLSAKMMEMHPEEFYAYLNQGTFGEKVTKEVEAYIKNKHPEVYKAYAFSKLRSNIQYLRKKEREKKEKEKTE